MNGRLRNKLFFAGLTNFYSLRPTIKDRITLCPVINQLLFLPNSGTYTIK